MAYDYSRLKGSIKEHYVTQENFAAVMGMTEGALSARLNNKTRFKQDEIVRACEFLNINPADIGDYFFKRKIQES